MELIDNEDIDYYFSKGILMIGSELPGSLREMIANKKKAWGETFSTLNILLNRNIVNEIIEYIEDEIY